MPTAYQEDRLLDLAERPSREQRRRHDALAHRENAHDSESACSGETPDDATKLDLDQTA
jgi:hypothetical protein